MSHSWGKKFFSRAAYILCIDGIFVTLLLKVNVSTEEKRAASQEKWGGRRNKRATAEIWKRIKRSLEKGVMLIKKKANLKAEICSLTLAFLLGIEVDCSSDFQRFSFPI